MKLDIVLITWNEIIWAFWYLTLNLTLIGRESYKEIINFTFFKENIIPNKGFSFVSLTTEKEMTTW